MGILHSRFACELVAFCILFSFLQTVILSDYFRALWRSRARVNGTIMYIYFIFDCLVIRSCNFYFYDVLPRKLYDSIIKLFIYLFFILHKLRVFVSWVYQRKSSWVGKIFINLVNLMYYFLFLFFFIGFCTKR